MSTDLEFMPQPGSRLAMAGREHQPEPADVAGEQARHPGPPSLHAVPTRTERAEETIYRTTVVLASAVRQLLPQDPGRYRATIMSIDQDIVLCDSKDQATNADNTATNVPQPQGTYWFKGIPLVIESKGLCWVANTSTASATRVSVVIERYAHAGTH